MADISKRNNLAAASFLKPERVTKQTEMIVSLIKESIEKEKPITIEDIVNVYANYISSTERGFRILRYDYITKCDLWKTLTKEEFLKDYYTKQKAKTWFKQNLGAAILKGKLLVIPIIEL